MAYELTRGEQETTVQWCAYEDTIHIDTSDPHMVRMLDKYCAQFPDEYKCIRVDERFKSKMYTCPLKRLQFKKSPTEKQKAMWDAKGKLLAQYRMDHKKN